MACVTIAALAAVAVVIPMKIAGARSVSSAIHGVFSRPTARFVVSTVGQRKLRGFTEVLTFSSTGGAALSRSQRADAEFAMQYHHGVLGEVFMSRAEVALRLNVRDIDGYMRSTGHRGYNLSRELDRVARTVPRFRFLRVLAASRWIGLKLGPLERFARAELALAAGGRPTKERKLQEEVGSSFAQTWHEVVSLTVRQTGRATREYSDRVPARAFARSFVRNLGAHLEASYPIVRGEMRRMLAATDRIPRRLTVPVHLWVRRTELVKVAASYGGRGVVVGISHPRALRPPTHVTFIRLSLRQILQLVAAGGQVYSSGGTGTRTVVVHPPGYRVQHHRARSS